MDSHTEQSSGVTGQLIPTLQSAAAFWAGYEVIRESLGETHRGVVLAGLCAEYHDILSREPIDIGRVERLTAEAALRMLGKRNY